jgi:hypothetical protein
MTIVFLRVVVRYIRNVIFLTVLGTYTLYMCIEVSAVIVNVPIIVLVSKPNSLILLLPSKVHSQHYSSVCVMSSNQKSLSTIICAALLNFNNNAFLHERDTYEIMSVPRAQLRRLKSISTNYLTNVF